MRFQERGIGNMAFIVVLVLLIISLAAFFLGNDEKEQFRNQANKFQGLYTKAVGDLDEMKNSYDALVEVIGLQEALGRGTDADGRPKTPIKLREAARAFIKTQTDALVAAGTIKFTATSFDFQGLGVKRGDGGEVTVTFYSPSDAEKAANFRGHVAILPKIMASLGSNLKRAVEDRDTQIKTMEATIGQKETANKAAADAYNEDSRRKQNAFDEVKRDHDNVNENRAALVQQVEDLRSENENAKTAHKKEVVLLQRRVQALNNALDNARHETVVAIREDPEDGRIIEVGRTRGTVWIDLGRSDKLARGTKFKVWRVGKGGLRQDIAMVKVIGVDGDVSECRIIEQINPGVRVAKGQSVSNPFYNPRETLTIYVFGDLTFYDTDVARRRLRAAGARISRYLDKSVDVIVLGEPPVVGGDDLGEEDDPVAAAKTRDMARDARLDRVLEKARSIGATVVSERVLRSFMDY